MVLPQPYGVDGDPLAWIVDRLVRIDTHPLGEIPVLVRRLDDAGTGVQMPPADTVHQQRPRVTPGQARATADHHFAQRELLGRHLVVQRPHGLRTPLRTESGRLLGGGFQMRAGERHPVLVVARHGHRDFTVADERLDLPLRDERGVSGGLEGGGVGGVELLYGAGEFADQVLGLGGKSVPRGEEPCAGCFAFGLVHLEIVHGRDRPKTALVKVRGQLRTCLGLQLLRNLRVFGAVGKPVQLADAPMVLVRQFKPFADAGAIVEQALANWCHPLAGPIAHGDEFPQLVGEDPGEVLRWNTVGQLHAVVA